MILLSMVTFIMLQPDYVYQPLTSSGDIYSGMPQYYCNGKWLAGGYGQFGKGNTISHTFSLPDHKNVQIKMNIMLGDSWDGPGNYLKIYLDGNQIGYLTKGPNDGSNICGSWYEDQWNSFEWSGSHTNNVLSISITNTLDEETTNGKYYKYLEWLGIADFQINYDDDCYHLYSECNYSGTEYKMCMKTPVENQEQFLSPIKSFKIPSGKALELEDPSFNGGNAITYTSDQACVNPYTFPKKITVPDHL